MSDKKKLLEEGSVRHFMKIAGLGKLSDTFLGKKILKESEASGRGNTFNPHGDDPRHDNLNEEEEDLEESEVTEESSDLELEEGSDEDGDVQEEGKGKLTPTGPGKTIESGKGLNGTGKKPTKKLAYEGKGKLTPTGPGKAIESGKGMNGAGKKPTKKMQFETTAEDGEQIEEGFGGEEPTDELGGEPDLGGGEEMAPPDMGGEEAAPATGDLQGLVKAIADAISAHTGVQVSVEGGAEGEGDLGGEPELPAPDAGAEGAPLPDEEEAPLPSPMQEAKRRAAAQKKPATKFTKQQKDQLVDSITKSVLAKLTKKAVKK